MQRLLIIAMLLVTAGFAVEVVTFDDNWGQDPQFNILSETQSGMEIVFSLHEMLIEDVDIDGVPMESYGFASIYIPQVGAPSLGGATRYIAIPQGAQVQVTVMDSRVEVYQNIEIAPAPNIPKETDDAPLRYEKDMAIYGRNAYYPESPVIVSAPMQIRGVDVVIMNVTPFQYNPVTRELVVYKDLRVRVDYVGGNGRFGEDRLRSRFWEPVLQGHLLNYRSLPEVDFYAPERLAQRDGWEYVIIVPDDPVFEAWADTIKAWRKLQGISCEVFTLTEVGGNTTTAIENFLNNAYNTWDPAPVAFLLLSDYPSSGDVYGITTQFYSGAASDNMYADVNGDHLPDMHHARICAQSDAQLSIMINKFLSYERNPYAAANFYNEPLVACGWQNDRWFQLCAEIVRGFFINVLGKDPARQYNLGTPANPTPGGYWSTNSNTSMIVAYFGSAGLGYIPDNNPYDATWWNNGSAAGVNAAINAGAFFVQHRDHGLETGWGEPYYRNNHLDDLTNTMYTFVNSHNCLTGKYNWSSECFSEKFHRIQYGALGLNAASEVSYSFVNDTYAWGMFDCLWPNFMPGYPLMGPQINTGHPNLMPCMAMTSGKYFLQQSNWPYNSGSKTITYHLFHHHGDAFNVLYSEVPQNLTVTHAPILFTGMTTFTISANDSSVIALTSDGDILAVAEGTGAPINMTIPPLYPGDTLKVTVTKANYYRYEYDVPVTSSTYPYVMYTTGIIDDATGGNGDGIVNPGETISYGVWAKNVGTGTAQSVYGMLSITDPYVTINADSSWYGTINENDSAFSAPSYEYAIAANCPDGHAISFDLEFHDIEDSIFISHPSITVYSPLLICQEYSISGGNGNDILEPGETVNVMIILSNDGSATAYNVSGTLTTNSSQVTINDPTGTFGNIGVGNSAGNTADPFNVTASASAAYGILVDCDLIIEAGLYTDTLDFQLAIGEPVPSDTGHYYVYYSGGLHSYAPVFDWFEIAPPGPGTIVSEITNEDADTVTVTLPFTFRYYGTDYTSVGLCSNGFLEMGSSTYRFGSNTGIPAAGGPRALIAGFWDDLDPSLYGDIYQYYDGANHRWILEFKDAAHYGASGDRETFQVILLDPLYYPTPTGDGEILVQYLNGMAQPGATFGIENYDETVGIQYYFDGLYHEWAVVVTDSFALKYTTYPPDYVGVEEYGKVSGLPVQTVLAQVFPNPFARELGISYQVAQYGRVRLAVYDALGREVCGLMDGMSEPGYYTVTWQACDAQGRRVPTGVYFVRFDSDEYQSILKTVLLK